MRLAREWLLNGALFHGTRVSVVAVHSLKSGRIPLIKLSRTPESNSVVLWCTSGRLKAERCPQRSYLF